MKQHVTVVPSDRLIIIDGNALRFDFPVPENMHALQWHDGSGHIEWTDDINHPLTSADYAGDVAPFVDLWEAEKARIEEEAAAAEASRLAEYNSEPGPAPHASVPSVTAALTRRHGLSNGTRNRPQGISKLR